MKQQTVGYPQGLTETCREVKSPARQAGEIEIETTIIGDCLQETDQLLKYIQDKLASALMKIEEINQKAAESDSNPSSPLGIALHEHALHISSINEKLRYFLNAIAL